MKLLKLYASWCVPCTALSATLNGVNHTLVEHKEDVSIETIEGIEVAKKYKVTSIPTMIIVDSDGNELRRMNGNHTKAEILKFLA